MLPQMRLFCASAEREASYRQRVMERASSNMRDRASVLRNRASHMRENARESYKEFREHPRESMREGAKSFSGMMRKYGPVFVGTYAGVYLTTLGSLFACVQSGLLDPAYLFSLFGEVDAGEAKSTVDLVVEWMRNHSFTEPYAPFMERNPYLANLAVAWIAIKFTEPIRAAVALGITPRVARSLGYANAAPEHDEEEHVAEQDAPQDVATPDESFSTETSQNETKTEKKV